MPDLKSNIKAAVGGGSSRKKQCLCPHSDGDDGENSAGKKKKKKKKKKGREWSRVVIPQPGQTLSPAVLSRLVFFSPLQLNLRLILHLCPSASCTPPERSPSDRSVNTPSRRTGKDSVHPQISITKLVFQTVGILINPSHCRVELEQLGSH